ncbi:RNA pyrophosphohydrolase [Teichococcus cervicalis]|uniref:RNA pyrophosphohydrolase n=1 Tax=Pseudoroseomonas cervicalis ATCC 49957 TaxID=525371 RepID=D5RI83_9PROT|nr:RNA pyrophosphohydrolase [Pseudoroseomonas cervicalis]EFH12989.1 hydrolase, NUDIX family [Pseudoroseomonas cervicalis ATCC 49957]
MTAELPYRRNVGAVLFHRDGRVLIARRADVAEAAWQWPQGGLDAGEDPAEAVLRELREEIGTASARILGEVPEWLNYDLPPELVGKALRGRYRGQSQKWFALGFTGDESEIRLDQDPHPEFSAWRWAALEEVPEIVVSFRQPIYRRVAAAFAPFKTWAAGGSAP